MNNFDFVSNLDRQMSLVGGRAETGGSGGAAVRGGVIVWLRSNASWVMVT